MNKMILQSAIIFSLLLAQPGEIYAQGSAPPQIEVRYDIGATKYLDGIFFDEKINDNRAAGLAEKLKGWKEDLDKLINNQQQAPFS